MNMSEGGAKVDTLEEIVDFDGSGVCGRERSFGTLAGGAEAMDSMKVEGDILPVASLGFLDEVADEPVVEVLAT
jgi:hypothetical protein